MIYITTNNTRGNKNVQTLGHQRYVLKKARVKVTSENVATLILLELVEAKKQGYGAGALFLIQIEDVNIFSPNDERDPKFGEALRFARDNGVDIFAYSCIVTEEGIELNKPIEIIL